jgi:phosphoribosylamine---glycine ligase
MNVLILGSGGREHALALAISKSKGLGDLYVAPGNPGCEAVAKLVELDIENSTEIVEFCQRSHIGFVVVGPEGPLVKGVSDDLLAAGIACFGPSKSAARLEGSKNFTKELCKEFGIPTAEFESFITLEPALAYVRAKGAPIVIKADGLAAGKGVTVAMTLEEAESAVRAMFDGAFGAAGSQIVIEEFLEGEEASLFAISDGHRVLAFGGAQDHKRVGDGDTGPNTGGMGAYSPAPVLSEKVTEQAMNEIVRPAVAGMAKRGAPFRGLLFAGLMIGVQGPKLIEFNVRFGDPETQAILSRFDDDLLEFLYSAAVGRLLDREPRFSPKTALAVVLAARGYPTAVEKGVTISGLKSAESRPGVGIIYAGARRVGEEIVSDGGRVLAVTAIADDILGARNLAYDALREIQLPGGFFRRDIGMRAVKRSQK